MSTLYQRRLEHEWELLEMLAAANRGVIEALGRRCESSGETFRIILRQTQGLALNAPDVTAEVHHAVLHFSRFFPSVPIEANLIEPVFHPNVHPENGFVCLWNRFSSGDTVMEAIPQLQNVVTWALINEQSEHLLQPDALLWYRNPERNIALPLPCVPVVKPLSFEMERTYTHRPTGLHRRRLS